MQVSGSEAETPLGLWYSAVGEQTNAAGFAGSGRYRTRVAVFSKVTDILGAVICGWYVIRVGLQQQTTYSDTVYTSYMFCFRRAKCCAYIAFVFPVRGDDPQRPSPQTPWGIVGCTTSISGVINNTCHICLQYSCTLKCWLHGEVVKRTCFVFKELAETSPLTELDICQTTAVDAHTNSARRQLSRCAFDML